MAALSPKRLTSEILHHIQRGVAPMVTSSPGIGKSSIARVVADTLQLELIDLRLSQCTPEDLQGFPMKIQKEVTLVDGSTKTVHKADFVPFSIFPLEGEEPPEGKRGWLLFLDEITSATKPVQAAAYKLVLDHMVGSYRLHESCAIMAAGNKSTDKAVVNQMSTALMTRMSQLEMEPNAAEWIEWAYSADIDTRVIAYIGYKNSHLMQFDPNKDKGTFACPRTWEFLSDLIKDTTLSAHDATRVESVIGTGVGPQFLTFVKEFDNIPKFEDILADPAGCMVPPEMSTKYATAAMLTERIDEKNAGKLLTYIDRFAIDLKIIFMRGAAARCPSLPVKSKEFKDEMLKLGRYLRG
jgi:hypothetical protein